MAKRATFTVRYLDSLKPKDKQYRVFEGRGFALRVLPSGTKSFSYRFTLDGKKQELSLGVYTGDKDSLADAHEKYRAAYAKFLKGVDPRYVEPAPALPESNTFKHFCTEYLEWSKKNHSPAWSNTLEKALQKDVLPQWSDKDIHDIKRRDAISLLEEVSKRAPGQTANVHKALSGVFEYAVQREYIEYNPVLRMSKVVPDLKYTPKDRVLTEAEIRHIWKSLGDSPTERALKLILVTAQRPGEAAGLPWSELDDALFSSSGIWWLLPKERAEKGKGDHLIYVTKTAWELIDPSYRCTYEVFGVKRNSLSQFVARNHSYFGLPAWTPHDLRRTARTFMAKIGVPEEHAEAVINHAKKGMVKVYNVYEYQDEKQAALLKWESELLRILGQTTAETQSEVAIDPLADFIPPTPLTDAY